MVKLAGETSFDLGGAFQVPTPGWHLMMFCQDPLGKEESDYGERFVFQLEVIDDPDENENGAQIRQSFPTEWDSTIDNVCNVLTCAGIDQEIEDIINKQYPNNDFTVLNDEVMEQIQMKLFGCVVNCLTGTRKGKVSETDKTPRTYGTIIRMEKVDNKEDAPPVPVEQSTRSTRQGSASRRTAPAESTAAASSRGR